MVYTIVVENSDKSQSKEYPITTDTLYKKGSVYDTINIDNTGTVTITRRIGIDPIIGESYILPTPIETTYGDIDIELYEGINYVSLKDDTNTVISLKYILKNDFTDTYATKVELNSSITQTADTIMLEVNKKVGEDELGTKIEQNYESVQIAWNQISDFIQFMIYKNNTSIAIKDENENVIMWLNKTGLHFNESGSDVLLGNMAVEKVGDDDFIAFSLPIQYNSSLDNGMAWGVTTTNDNKFHPILYLKEFEMANQQSDASYGKLVLESCDLFFNGLETGIVSGNIYMHGNVFQGITFENNQTGDILLNITPTLATYKQEIIMLNGKIQFFENQQGSYTFKIGDNNSNCIFTDSGYISSTNTISCDNGLNVMSGDLNVFHGNAWANNFYQNSTKDKKKNFQKLKSGLDIIKNIEIYKYNFKTEDKNTKKHIGLVIGDDFKYSKEVTSDDNKGVDTYSFVSVCCKAIQEQQEMIEKQQKEIDNLKKEIKKIKEEKNK